MCHLTSNLSRTVYPSHINLLWNFETVPTIWHLLDWEGLGIILDTVGEYKFSLYLAHCIFILRRPWFTVHTHLPANQLSYFCASSLGKIWFSIRLCTLHIVGSVNGGSSGTPTPLNLVYIKKIYQFWFDEEKMDSSQTNQTLIRKAGKKSYFLMALTLRA